MELDREVRYTLPRHVNPNRITYHVKLPSGLNSPVGETHLLAHNGRLVVLSKNNNDDSLAPVALATDRFPQLLHEEWQDILILVSDQGRRFRIPLPNNEVGPVAFLLEQTKDQPPEPVEEEEDASDGSPGSEDVGSGDVSFESIRAESAGPAIHTEPTPDVDITPSDPASVMEGVRLFAAASKLSPALSWAKTVPEQSGYYAPEAEDVVAVIEALERDEPAEAFLLVELSDLIPVGLHDALLRPIAHHFQRNGEPIWAAASLMAALESQDEIGLANIFRQLGRESDREEHQDWLLSELERLRSTLISEKILRSRSDPTWRELRARLAGRRGGHALALRELKLLSERFPGRASIETARLRALWDSHQRDTFRRLVDRCAQDFVNDPPGLARVLRVAQDVGAAPTQLMPMLRRLQELHPEDRSINDWADRVGAQIAGSGGEVVLVGLGAGALALGLGWYFFF